MVASIRAGANSASAEVDVPTWKGGEDAHQSRTRVDLVLTDGRDGVFVGQRGDR